MNTQKEYKNIVLYRRFLVSYKKNTLAIFFSFALTFLLSTVLLVLIHTNHRIESIKYQAKFSASDCYIRDLTKQQIKQLKRFPDITNIAITSTTKQCNRNLQTVYLNYGDNDYITMTAKLIEGTMPKEENEVVAEEWVLLNLGIEPILNQEFDISIGQEEKEIKTLKLVGILSDMPMNKQYGVLELYTTIEKEAETYVCYIRFKDSVNDKEQCKELRRELGIRKKQIHYNPARENYSELFRIDIQILGIVLFVCMVVFYGVYRIAQITRRKQYGILRAIGMKRKQLRHMILLELYQIYCMSVPIGIAVGLFLAFIIVKASGDGNTMVYLYNQSVRFVPVVPVKQILILVIIAAVLIGFVGYFAARKVVKKSVIELLSSDIGNKNYSKLHYFQWKRKGGKWQVICSFGERYILKDIKTSFFIVLTICTGIVLFTGLSYHAKIVKTYQQDIKEWEYLNGQYVMSLNESNYNSPYQGISREDVKNIAMLSTVSNIKTCAELPIRVIDDGKKRNDQYYNDMNDYIKNYYGIELAGNDGVDQVFQSNLCGYNTEALEELEQYILSGNFDAKKGLARDEIILGILSLDDRKEDGAASWYKNGNKLMSYQAGDNIKIKYRKDFHTEGEDYLLMQDKEEEYIYKEYKVTAIVYFDYMHTVPRTNIYPLLITDDKNIKEIVRDGCYQCIYIDSKPSMTAQQQDELEQKLIRIGRKGEGGIASRSMVSEIRQNEMFYRKQMIYVFGIAVITFILVFINMVNNIIYRMQSRTKEICMLRAIGMSITMTRQIQILENSILSCIAVILAYLISQPILQYLYQISDMEVYGHYFSYDYISFFTISITMLFLCIGLSGRILKSWKTKQIMEGIGKIE